MPAPPSPSEAGLGRRLSTGEIVGQEILDQRQSVGEGRAADQGGQGLRWAWISSTKVLSQSNRRHRSGRNQS